MNVRMNAVPNQVLFYSLKEEEFVDTAWAAPASESGPPSNALRDAPYE